MFHRTHLRQLILRNAGRHAQADRIVDRQQGATRRSRFARFDQPLGNNPGKWRADTGVTQTDAGLPVRRLRRLEVSPGLVQRGRADEILLAQILQALEIGFGVDELRRGAGRHFARLACVDAQQQFALLYRLPGIDPHLGHTPGDLRGQGGLDECLDIRLDRQRQFDRMRSVSYTHLDVYKRQAG